MKKDDDCPTCLGYGKKIIGTLPTDENCSACGGSGKKRKPEDTSGPADPPKSTGRINWFGEDDSEPLIPA